MVQITDKPKICLSTILILIVFFLSVAAFPNFSCSSSQNSMSLFQQLSTQTIPRPISFEGKTRTSRPLKLSTERGGLTRTDLILDWKDGTEGFGGPRPFGKIIFLYFRH